MSLALCSGMHRLDIVCYALLKNCFQAQIEGMYRATRPSDLNAAVKVGVAPPAIARVTWYHRLRQTKPRSTIAVAPTFSENVCSLQELNSSSKTDYV